MTKKVELEARVIEASVRLFSSQGYHGTSTREIAELAQVNENSMFRHFHRKEDLFWVALESRLKNVRVHEELQAALSQGARPDIAVPMIMELMVRSITNDPELVRLLSISVLELRHGAARICREHLAPICKAIDEYLVGSIERGSLRALDPSLISAAFAVTAIMHSGVYQLLTGRETPYCNANEAISAYSKFWLEALAPSAHQDTSGTPR